jgi:putative transposase
MEDDTSPILFRFHGPSPLPGLGASQRLRENVDAVFGRIRRLERDRLGVASSGQRYRIGARKRGDLTGKNPTDRGKLGTKRHLLVDGHGIPLSVTLSSANDHDKLHFPATLDARVVSRPSPKNHPQNLCADKGYDYADTRRSGQRRGYKVHIPRRGKPEQVPAKQKKHPARRWVIERTNRWHNLFRRLKIRYEVHASNYLGFVQLASAIICFRCARC